MTSRNQRKNKRSNKRRNQNASQQNRPQQQRAAGDHQDHVHRSSTETKASFKTTELFAYAGTVLAIILTALALDDDGQGGGDPFGAEPALRYITYLTIGYMVARGLAKAGSHENYVDHDDDDHDDHDHHDDHDTRHGVGDADDAGRAGDADGAGDGDSPADVTESDHSDGTDVTPGHGHTGSQDSVTRP